MNKISSFSDEFFFLSNFYPSPVFYDGVLYRNNEAAFQAQKCLNAEDRVRFCSLNPTEAKHLGRKVSLRKDWESVKVSIMTDIVKCKFEQNPVLAEKLLLLKDVYLEEGNDWGDKIWGTVNGQGKNLLGQILMEVREKEILKQKLQPNYDMRE